jgi:hypothetical protein
MTASHLELHLLFTVAESLAAATADLAPIADLAAASPLLADVLRHVAASWDRATRGGTGRRAVLAAPRFSPGFAKLALES